MKNSDRFLLQELRAFARENGLQLEEYCHHWAHKLTNPKTGKSSFVFGYDLGLNSSAVAQICRDKVATSEILCAAGIPVVPHRLIIQPNRLSYAPSANVTEVLEKVFDESEGQIVVKPNEGTGGNDVYRLQSIAQAVPVIQRLHAMDKAAAVCPYIEVEREWRVYVLNGEAKIVLRKVARTIQGDGVHDVETLARREYDDPDIDDFLRQSPQLADEWRALGIPSVGQTVSLNWRNNLSQGAIPSIVETSSATGKLEELAIKVSQVLGLVVGSVDIVLSKDQTSVIEVNSGVMMERLFQKSEKAKAISTQLLHDSWRSLHNEAES